MLIGNENREAMYEFVIDRLRGYLLDSSERITAEMFEAVRLRRPSSMVDFRERINAVVDFMRLEPSVSLAAANKRTANILRKAGIDSDVVSSALDTALLQDDAERVLYHAMLSARKDIGPLISARAYSDALRRLAELRTPVDAFFRRRHGHDRGRGAPRQSPHFAYRTSRTISGRG